MENYLRIRVDGREGYLKAFLNQEKEKDSEPDYKGKDISVWVNQGKPEEAAPKVQPTRL